MKIGDTVRVRPGSPSYGEGMGRPLHNPRRGSFDSTLVIRDILASGRVARTQRLDNDDWDTISLEYLEPITTHATPPPKVADVSVEVDIMTRRDRFAMEIFTRCHRDVSDAVRIADALIAALDAKKPEAR